ncbi:MAG: hypothetical protein IKU13_01220 [Clostridia bacterium]|nr:hypothetical protein [Clostridia bacterium]MBR5266294.1 hypothetical protein [Clostridia bacterium]
MLKNYLYCFGMFVLCLIPPIIIAGTIKFKIGLSGEPFRKLLHTIAYLCPLFVLCFADSWTTADMVFISIAALAYPFLSLAEKHEDFAPFFSQRRDGEVKSSLLQLFFGMSVLTAVCWGIFNKPFIVVAAVMMWGPGDAAAALVGKRFGKHKIRLPLADKKKSWEGSLSFMALSFIFGAIVLMIFGKIPLFKAILCALVPSICGSYTELITKGGYDTVTVPFVNAIVLLLMI